MKSEDGFSRTSRRKEEPRNSMQEPSEQLSRAQVRKFRQKEAEEEKRRLLGRKLNWTILFLVLSIVLVYCFMIFINF
ncbi:hypothetical protein [Liquorilactobacillus oeni]|uniref:hypothetical protein n=1 Tax=Liquorilactobacillus oeni TaxID=303241 RepID=UPI001F273EF4|nr:hypothetical protein [Liquorilactobacillus oeni]